MNELGFIKLIEELIFGEAGYAGYQQYKRYYELSEYLDTVLSGIVAQKQVEVTQKIADQRAKGQDIDIVPVLASAEVRGVPLLLKFFERGNHSRVDVYYGGIGAPDGDLHGHIIFKNGQLEDHIPPGVRRGKQH